MGSRVLFLSPDYPPARGGTADYAGWLTRDLASRGFVIRVLTSTRSAGAAIPGVQIAATVARWDRSLWRALEDEVRTFSPDVLHVQYQQFMYQQLPAIGFVPWVLRTRGLRPPIVTTLHDMTPPLGAPPVVRRLALESLIFGSDRLLVSSEGEYQGLAKRPGRQQRTVVLPIGSNIAFNALDPSRRGPLRASVTTNPNAVLIVTFGLIRPGKGVEVLLDAVSALRKRHQVELLVIGDVGDADLAARKAYREQLHQRSRTLGLDGAVRFLGHLPEAEVSQLLQVSDLAVLPFLQGASAGHTTVLAALSHGLPLVTTRGTNTPSDFAAGAMVLVDAPPDEPRLAGAIERLIEDPRLREATASAGRELGERFSRNAIASRIASIYLEVQHPKTPIAMSQPGQ